MAGTPPLGAGPSPRLMTAEDVLFLDHGWQEPTARPVCLVDLSARLTDPGLLPALRALLATVPCLTVGVNEPDTSLSGIVELVDLLLPASDPRLERALQTIETHPVAGVTLAVLLRQQRQVEPAVGVVMESACYSALQTGREFARWRRTHHRRHSPDDPSPRVGMRVEGGVIRISLQRPGRHNAIDRQMRQELFDAFTVAAGHSEPIILDGVGPSFSSGGDLDEFGSFTDPAASHLVRIAAHPALAMLTLGSDRLTARVHGHCLGGGLELAAFAGRVEADVATRFGLPETRLGLLPGAGGTVSLTRRIGARRVLELALCHDTIDAPTALEWGLIDALA